jgi:heptosyltransferase-1
LKILIVKPSALGDVVQALPVLRLLRIHYPEAEIDWWISTELAGILDEDVDLSRKVLFYRRDWSRLFFVPMLVREIARVRARCYDLVIDLQGLARSALLSWAGNGGTVIGVEDWREGAPALYDLRVPRPGELSHAVDWYFEVLRRIHVPVHRNFEWFPRKEKAAAAVERKWPRKGPRVILNPGARWKNKRWPIEYFLQIAEFLAKDYPEIQITLLGGSNDKPLARAISSAMPDRIIDTTGLTTLPELVEVIRTASVMITNDTGPMHIAAALQIPIVALFGPTTPFRTGPYGQLDRILQTRLHCVPCMKPVCSNPNQLECLKSIPPDEVFGRVLQVLNSR